MSQVRVLQMKTAADPRHQKRVRIVQQLFADSFGAKSISTRYQDIKKRQQDIDALIAKTAPQFPVEKIARIDVAILRLAVFELLFLKKEPARVVIDEAVELAKEFGGEGSPAFVNGVLGALYEHYCT